MTAWTALGPPATGAARNWLLESPPSPCARIRGRPQTARQAPQGLQGVRRQGPAVLTRANSQGAHSARDPCTKPTDPRNPGMQSALLWLRRKSAPLRPPQTALNPGLYPATSSCTRNKEQAPAAGINGCGVGGSAGLRCAPGPPVAPLLKKKTNAILARTRAPALRCDAPRMAGPSPPAGAQSS